MNEPPPLTADEFKGWKRRRRCTNQDIASLTGLSVSTIDKKLNGRTRISNRLPRELANIDKLIARGEIPAACPERLARLIVARDIR